MPIKKGQSDPFGFQVLERLLLPGPGGEEGYEPSSFKD